MQRDLKIGLSLGVLLIGVVGAFLNRREVATPHSEEAVAGHTEESVQTAQNLDERIAEKPHKPYLTGIESDDFPTPKPKRPPLRQSPPPFSLEEFADDHEVTNPPPEPQRRASAGSTDAAPPRSATAERSKPKSPVSSALKDRSPSVHSISVSSNVPGPKPPVSDPVLEQSTVPPADVLDGESAKVEPEPAQEPVKQGPLFTRPTRGIFARRPSQDDKSGKSGAKSRSSQPPTPQGKTESQPKRQASKGNAAGNSAKQGDEREKTSESSPADTAVPGTYKVKPGDSLDKIALQFYRSTSKAQAIFDANKDKLKSPNSIREGMQIKLP